MFKQLCKLFSELLLFVFVLELSETLFPSIGSHTFAAVAGRIYSVTPVATTCAEPPRGIATSTSTDRTVGCLVCPASFTFFALVGAVGTVPLAFSAAVGAVSTGPEVRAAAVASGAGRTVDQLGGKGAADELGAMPKWPVGTVH